MPSRWSRPDLPAATPVFECERLVAGYTEAITQPVTMRLRSGDAIALRGENGVGKSTLLRGIGGSAKIFSGSMARAPGVELLHHQQQWDAGPELPLTGLDICRLTGASVAAAPSRLQSLLGRRLDELSGGQTQLVRLWSCLGSSAGLLLLDEPTNNLDAIAIGLLTDMVRERSVDRAIIVVSHESAFLDAVCNLSITLESPC